MTIRDHVAAIIAAYHEQGGNLLAEDWETVAELFGIIKPFPNLPSPLFIPAGRLFVPAAIELVIIQAGKVLLVKRDFLGDVAYHTPGTYLAPDETWLQAAQRCANAELKGKVLSAEPFGKPVNHPVHPRFHDLSVLLRCEIEDELQAGEWFGPDDQPKMLGVQSEYWAQIQPLLRETV